jgi:hypothetical protein
VYLQLYPMSGGCPFHLESDYVLDSCFVVRAQVNTKHVGENKNAYRILVRNVVGKKLSGSTNCRCEDKIKVSNHTARR